VPQGCEPHRHLTLRRGPFGRVLVGTKDSGAACATLGLSWPAASASAQDAFIGAGTIILALSSDGVLPLVSSRWHRWWSGPTAPGSAAVPLAADDRAGTLAGTRAAW